MKLKHIKWELITTLLFAVFSIDCMIDHVVNHNLEFTALMLEIVIYTLFAGMIYLVIYDLRTEKLSK